MTDDPPQNPAPQPATDRADARPPATVGVEELSHTARLLLDHAQVLMEGQRDRRWIGMTELRRRTALLVHICAGAKEFPNELAMLVGLLLCGTNDLINTKGSLHKAWLAAINYEARFLPRLDGNPFPASVRAVATAAFGKQNGDHRKTIRQWRKEYDYRWFVKTYRLAWLSKAARDHGKPDLEEALLDRIPAMDFTSDLRLTTPPHGQRKAFNAHLHVDHHFWK